MQILSKTTPIIELFERKEFVARVETDLPVEDVQAAIRRELGLDAVPVSRSRSG